MCLARELTKVHQQFIRGTARHLVEALNEPRGEFTIVVGPADNSMLDSDILLSEAEIVQRFWQSTESREASRREIVAMLARQSGRSPKDVYAIIEHAKKSGIRP
jgi:16S rRNA (cytidine1402-2'-O)-methyltransferase